MPNTVGCLLNTTAGLGMGAEYKEMELFFVAGDSDAP